MFMFEACNSSSTFERSRFDLTVTAINVRQTHSVTLDFLNSWKSSNMVGNFLSLKIKSSFHVLKS